jgi:hypothetical protein
MNFNNVERITLILKMSKVKNADLLSSSNILSLEYLLNISDVKGISKNNQKDPNKLGLIITKSSDLGISKKK